MAAVYLQILSSCLTACTTCSLVSSWQLRVICKNTWPFIKSEIVDAPYILYPLPQHSGCWRRMRGVNPLPCLLWVFCLFVCLLVIVVSTSFLLSVFTSSCYQCCPIPFTPISGFLFLILYRWRIGNRDILLELSTKLYLKHEWVWGLIFV